MKIYIPNNLTKKSWENFKKNKLIIEIPLTKYRQNPYMDDDYKEEMDNIVGLIEGDEMGFCYYIDMGYKGKDDQWTDFFFKFFGEKEDFERICNDLNIDLIKC